MTLDFHRTIVITGASSGIGRAVALAAARAGHRVVLAARRQEVLEGVARECGRASMVAAMDVTDPQALENLLSQAISRFGGVDMWVNCAVVAAVGAYAETPWQAHEQTVKVGLLGVMHGSHVAIRYFQKRGQGVLVNLNSIGAWVPAPYVAAYSACKYGLRGFAEALRAELTGFPQVHVCEVYPGFVDTPAFQHSANYVGREIKPAPPLTHPDVVAAAVLRLLDRPQASTFVGRVSRLGKMAHAVAPSLVSWGMARFLETYFQIGPKAPVGDGHLYRSAGKSDSVTGGWSERASRKAWQVGLLAVAACVVGGAVAGRSRGDSKIHSRPVL